ncbi:MAG: tetratricopeptide repeat protein [Planctomycetota bacterium]
MRLRVLIALVGWLGLCGCGSVATPPIPDDPKAALELGVTLLPTSAAQALAVFESIDRDSLQKDDAERLDVLIAQATAGTGDLWGAYEVVREIQDRNRFSRTQVEIQELHFAIGKALFARDASYFIFGSDRGDARIVLREFIERYPTDPNAASGLQLLGEDAFAEHDWDEARRRYEQIIQDHPDSEWIPLAHFRHAMAEFAALIGPAYDLPSLRRARNELRDYLAVDKPERPDFKGAAEAALATADDWLAQRYMLDAGFYRTLGNAPGERFWLEQYLAEFAGRTEAEAVRTRLSELGGDKGGTR